ncbi:MAG: electron transport complex subunit RsxC [Clostridiales bacterium]|nr:electron transport complex subunit RsxC [Clostridiales bacterium]
MKSFYKIFSSGVHPRGMKSLSAETPIEVCPAPKRVYIALNQHIGKPASPVVEAGETVRMGQLIARANGAVSANIFSSVSGKVAEIAPYTDAAGTPSIHIVVDNDGLDTPEKAMAPLESPAPRDIVKRIADAGVVGMGGAGFPAHVKLSPKKQPDVYIINAAECEPYITCDYRLLMEYTEKVVRGAVYLAAAVGVAKVRVGVEANKPRAIDALKKFKAENGLKDLEIVPLKTRYPQGAEKQLIYAITRRRVPSGGLPMDCGVIVSNTHTALSAYLAIREGKPLYERVMTVSGKGIRKPSNLWVRNGTRYGEIAAACGGELGNTAKIVGGGPMMGASQISRDIAVTKTSGSLLFLTKDEFVVAMSSPCINCGKCGRACPMRLMPMYIDSFALAGDYAGSKKYGALECIECGCCSYICPANRYLMQSVKLAKKKIKEMGL